MINNKPFFSMIIPALNEEDYLPHLLFCLEKQTENNFELIVVDGNSIDKTAKIAKTFSKKNRNKFKTTLIISGKKNVSLQRNLGAAKARGKYLIFLDADVKLPRNYLSKIKAHIEEYGSFFMTTWNEADSSDQQDKIFFFLTNFIFEASQLLEINFVPGFNIILKKEAFNKVKGFDEQVVHAEDHDLARRLKEKGYELVILKEPKITFSLRRFKREGTINVLRKYAKATLHIFLKGPIIEELFKYEMGGHLYKKMRKKRARSKLLKKQLKLIQDKIELYFQLFERKINGIND